MDRSLAPGARTATELLAHHYTQALSVQLSIRRPLT
jgi:hypothetical protein